MTLSPELIAAFIGAITTLLTAVAGWVGRRERQKAEELKKVTEDYADLREQILLSDSWMFSMTRALSQNGIPIPEPPSGLRTNFGVKRHDDSH